MAEMPKHKMLQKLRASVAKLDQSREEYYAAREWLDTGEASAGYRFEIRIECLGGGWQATLISGFGGHAPTRERMVARVML